VRLRWPARSFDLHQHLTTLFVCAVATVLFTRALLAATGYPQVGGSSLHIAHVLWGGLLLLAAMIAVLAFLSLLQAGTNDDLDGAKLDAIADLYPPSEEGRGHQ